MRQVPANNAKLKREHGQLHLIKIEPKVWKRVGIDLIGPLPTSKRDNKSIITCTDYFSKWVEAKGLPDRTTHSVVAFLFRLFCCMGCFECCHLDQGRESVNELNHSLFMMAGIDHWHKFSLSSTEHNGFDERSNQTISLALPRFINLQKMIGMSFLTRVLFSYRTSVHASTKDTLFYLMYSRDPVLPIELKVSSFVG